jgi:hypothetical protein
VSDLTLSQQPGGLLIQATLRTDHYVETKAIHSVDYDLRVKYGPDTKLQIDQILVTHGGVAAVKTARV